MTLPSLNNTDFKLDKQFTIINLYFYGSEEKITCVWSQNARSQKHIFLDVKLLKGSDQKLYDNMKIERTIKML